MSLPSANPTPSLPMTDSRSPAEELHSSLPANSSEAAASQDTGLIDRVANLSRYDYKQRGTLFRRMTSEQQKRLFGKVAHHLSRVPWDLKLSQICDFFYADPACGIGVAHALGICMEREVSPAGGASI